MKLHHKNKSINIPVKKANKVLGLMFRTKNTKNLLFSFNEPTRIAIHSLFVFHDFLAVWLDKDNNVLEYKLVTPFTLSIKPSKIFSKLVEIPFNDQNKNIFHFFRIETL
jgi:uncharacterized membrane protein (UPF0127 family)